MHFLKAAVVGAIASLFATLLLLSTAYARADERTPQSFNIGPQSLAAALNEFARQSHEELLFAPEAVALKSSHGVRGTMEPLAALKILLTDSGLTYSTTPAGAILVGAPGSASALSQGAPYGAPQNPGQAPPPGSSLQLAQLDQAPAGPQVSEESKESKKRAPEILEEVVVTGTHLRGDTSSASPVQIYTRDDIDRLGVGTVEQFVQLLPQNFGGGGTSENSAQGIAGAAVDQNNFVRGTGVNLRGLGTNSTLVLVNGRRIAPGNVIGDFADVSQIPLAAVERVEVVSDGASAIYGADAVGGVINFILRRDFEGAETRGRYSVGASGHPSEYQVAQTLGHQWSSGSALLSYQFTDRTALTVSQREFTQDAQEPTDLLPKDQKQGVYGTIRQSLSPKTEIFADGIFTDASVNDSQAAPGAFAYSTQLLTSSKSYNGTLGTRTSLPHEFELDLTTSYAKGETHHTEYSTQVPVGPSLEFQTNSSVASVDAVLSGSLFQIPAGPIRSAFGLQYRRDSLDFENPLTSAGTHSFNDSRHDIAGFAELGIPLLGKIDSNPAANELELTLADRAERYSDFGYTNNPKAGLTWQPSVGLKVRATIGTSFRAPLLYDLNPYSNTYAVPQPDPKTGGVTNALVVFGGDPNLQPEKSRSWTVGLDLHPATIPGWKTTLTYYNINFKDKVQQPSDSGISLFFGGLQNEGLLGPQIVQRNPPLALVEQLINNSAFQDLTGPGFAPNPAFNPASIGAIVDNRYRNLAKVNTSGIDFGTAYLMETGVGSFETGVDGTFILQFDNQVIATLPATKILNTPYNPNNLKFRAREVYQHGNLTIAGYINYVNSYTDDRIPTAPERVSSWTTADLTIGYRVPEASEHLGGLSVLLSVVNLTNKSPPFVSASLPTFPGINFDGTNANALGRYVSLLASKRF